MTCARRRRAPLERLAELLDPSVLGLFDDRFVRSWELYGCFVDRLAARVLHTLAGDLSATGWVSTEELAERLELVPERAGISLRWLLLRLAAADVLEVEDGDGRELRFRAPTPWIAEDPAEIRRRQEAHDPTALASYDLAELAAAAYPAFLRGEVAGEAVLFGPEQMTLWSRYFANSNPLYAVNNRVGAAACVRWAPQPIGGVLELGGGLGSGAVALVEALAAADRLGEVSHYRFTDLAPPFLRRGLRAATAAAGDLVDMNGGRLDIDRPFADQGVEDGSCGLIWAVNTVHVASDLGASLGWIRDALRPGGVVVLGECLRPFPDEPVDPELIFNLLEAFRSPRLDPRWRPRGGFLTPEEWRAACLAAGFHTVELLPDVVRVRELYPTFVVGAVVAQREA